MIRLLLLSNNDIDQSFFNGVSNFIKVPILKVNSTKEVCQQLESDPEAVIIFDANNEESFQEFESTLAKKFGLFSNIINPNLFFYTGDKELHEVTYLTQSEIFGSYIPRNFKQENEFTIGRIILSAVDSINPNRTMEINRFFSANAKIQKIKITRSIIKQSIVEALKNHLIELGFKSRAAAVIASAADEIIMNAIFDAPIDETGKNIYLQTPRNADFMLDQKSEVHFSVGFDGRTLGISVQDNYGSLDKKKLLRHISKSYRSDEYKVRSNVAGAGLGLAQVYRNCGGIIFECEQGNRTQVTILFRKTDSFKDFKDQFRFLSTLVQYNS
jgi:hypothetical protein